MALEFTCYMIYLDRDIPGEYRPFFLGLEARGKELLFPFLQAPDDPL